MTSPSVARVLETESLLGTAPRGRRHAMTAMESLLGTEHPGPGAGP